jgi:DNA primase large subunit
VVDLFRGQSDFNEEKTRYFVEDAAKKGYKPFRCSTILELGFCLGEQCSLRRRKVPS